MELEKVRRLPWPELILLTCLLVMGLGVMVRSSTGECHQWKDRLNRVTGTFLAAAGEKEFPQPRTETSAQAEERAALHRATKRMLDDRPMACL